MNFDLALVGETWESSFALATASALEGFMSDDALLFVPPAFSKITRKLGVRTELVEADAGFAPYDALWQAARARRRPDRGLLLLAAGALPARANPIERLGDAEFEQRVFEWLPPASGGGASKLHFERPPHAPPRVPHHVRSRLGTLDFWSVNTGGNYFQALLSLAPGAPPLWPRYGENAPVFAFNTNEFRESPPPACDEYAILGSGLLGLKLVVESGPADGAHVVVYDINPRQLEWIRCVLASADTCPSFESVVERFKQLFPAVSVRDVLPHEAENAARQSAWYADNRSALAALGRRLRWSYVVCDLLTEPLPLLSRFTPGRRLFFMFLDLFLAWNLEDRACWVEHHAGMAESLRRLIRERVGDTVHFLPPPHTSGFQIAKDSPFLAGAACT